MATRLLGIFHLDCGFSFLAGLLADDAVLRGRTSRVGYGQEKRGRLRTRCRVLAVLVVCLFAGLPLPASYAAEPEFEIDIPVMNAAEALNRLAEQSGAVMLFSFDLARAYQANAVRGRYTLLESLELLLKDTGLTGGLSERRLVVIAQEGTLPDKGGAVKKRGGIAGLIAAVTGIGSANVQADQAVIAQPAPEKLEEVVVTGTNLRGLRPVGAQPIVLDRKEIDRTGLTTVEEVVRTLPQNFQGDVSDDTAVGPGTNSNAATAFNLRGLGAGATLTLIDGRRLPAGGSEGSFVDASNIPLSAVERIEVLADGTSAIYGSDAVAGVVNVILRDDYHGAETLLQGGSVTDGDQGLIRVSQLLGGSWRGGRGLLSLEYYQRDELDFADRDYLRTSDLRELGGDDFRERGGNPGNILVGDQTFAIPIGQDGRSLEPDDLIAGSSNFYNQNEARTALSDQEKQNVFGSVTFNPSTGLEISADAFYTERESETRTMPGVQFLTVPSTHPFFVDPVGGNSSVTVAYSLFEDFGPRVTTSDLQTWSAGLGSNIELAGSWILRANASYSEETSEQIGTGGNAIDFAALDAALNDPNPETAFNPFGDGSHTNPATLAAISSDSFFDTDSSIWEVRAVANGELFDIGGRTVRLAAGIDYRDLKFSGIIPDLDFVTGDFSRQVTGVFSELYIPLLNPSPQRSGSRTLELSLAGRFEDYSDFGSTSVPKIGLTWRPLDSWTFRATWGESFKAPNLADLSTVNNGVFFIVEPDPVSGEQIPTLIAFGKNADLTPETAKSWLVGAGFVPESLPTLRVDASYYDIEFSDRVVEPLIDGFTDLSNPLFVGLITRDPSAEEIAALCATGPLYFGPGNCADADVSALLDARVLNAASNNQSGIDLLSSFRVDTTRGYFDFTLNANYILEFEQQFNSAADVVDVVDTVFNPPDLRLRGSVSWQAGGWTTTVFANYTDSYSDNISQPNRKVDSWTTVDLTAAFSWPETAGWLAGSRVSLNVQNAFEEDPPFLNSALGGYDRQNADPTGRFISLTVAKKW